MQHSHTEGPTQTPELPALPSRGHSVSFEVASRTTTGTHYAASLGVTVSGTVVIDCGCPARRRCWHVDAIETIIVARGEARRDPHGALVTTEHAGHDDPFAGLLGEAVV